MYRYHICVLLYMDVRSHNETYLIAALTSSNFRRDIFFHVLHNRKTQKNISVCIMWRKVMNSKGYFYDSDNDDQDDNNNSPFYDMH